MAALIPSPAAESAVEDSGVQVGEPTLSQIMSTIKQCQASLSMKIDTLWVDFSLLKDDVHKIRHRGTNA